MAIKWKPGNYVVMRDCCRAPHNCIRCLHLPQSQRPVRVAQTRPEGSAQVWCLMVKDNWRAYNPSIEQVVPNA